MTVFTASHVEDATLEWLSGLGYAVVHGSAIAPGRPATAERVSYDQVFLLIQYIICRVSG